MLVTLSTAQLPMSWLKAEALAKEHAEHRRYARGVPRADNPSLERVPKRSIEIARNWNARKTTASFSSSTPPPLVASGVERQFGGRVVSAGARAILEPRSSRRRQVRPPPPPIELALLSDLLPSAPWFL